jgi:type II secretory pathway pseudopilin PulG
MPESSRSDCRCMAAAHASRLAPRMPVEAPPSSRRRPPLMFGTSATAPARFHQRGYLLLEALCAFALLLAGLFALASLGPVALGALRAQVSLSQAVRVAAEAAETMNLGERTHALVSLSHVRALTAAAVRFCAEPTTVCASDAPGMPAARFVIVELPASPTTSGDGPASDVIQPLRQLALWVRP